MITYKTSTAAVADFGKLAHTGREALEKSQGAVAHGCLDAVTDPEQGGRDVGLDTLNQMAYTLYTELPSTLAQFSKYVKTTLTGIKYTAGTASEPPRFDKVGDDIEFTEWASLSTPWITPIVSTGDDKAPAKIDPRKLIGQAITGMDRGIAGKRKFAGKVSKAKAARIKAVLENARAEIEAVLAETTTKTTTTTTTESEQSAQDAGDNVAAIRKSA